MFGQQAQGSVAAALQDVKNIISANGHSLNAEHAFTAITAGTEAANLDMATANAEFDSVKAQLADSSLSQLLADEIGCGIDDARVDAGIEAAAYSAIALLNDGASKYAAAYGGGKSKSSDAEVIGALTAGNEGYDFKPFDEFVESTIIYNALSAVNNDFSEAFFRTKTIPANSFGIDIKVSVPEAYRRTPRGANGAAYSLTKHSLINALHNHEVLESGSTALYPRAVAANDAFLTPTADVATFTKVVDGVDLSVRPIAFGAKADLLALSAHPGLINGTQDETDTLDPSMSIGTVYVKITNPSAASAAGVTQVFALNTKGMQGSLFTRPAEGSTSDLTVNFDGMMAINQSTTDIAGVESTALELHTELGLAGGAKYAMQLAISISGKANTETGNVQLHANAVELAAVVAGEDGMTKVDIDGLTGDDDLVIELVGYLPAARRSNANMRQGGLYIESGSGKKFCLPAEIQAPLSTAKPVSGESYAVSVAGLNAAHKVKIANNAVSTLLEFESILANKTGIAGTAAQAGELLVTPTYKKESLDLSSQVAVMRSAGAMDDLRETVVNAITTMVMTMVLESGYNAALSITSGSNAYEVIIGTDPYIATLLMTSGDNRTLGNNVPFRVVSSDDARMKGQIKLALRRQGSMPEDPLNFGVHGVVTPLLSEATRTENGSTSQVVQLQPRDRHHVLCPVMGSISVAGIDTIFLTSAPVVS